MTGPVAMAMALVQAMTGMPAASTTASQTAAPAPAPTCPPTPTPAPPPAAYAGWNGAQPLTAGRDAGAAAALTPGKGARVTLDDVASVHWALPPGHAPAPGSRGGLVALTVATAGRYRVALGTGAWIDVVRDGAEVRSAAHSHGPACTPIRKIVDFDLQPGRYLIQLSGTTAATVDVMAQRVAG